MEQSILKSTKKILGIAPDDDSFDLDVTTHINSALFDLHQLGVGPANGFSIEDDAQKWEDFLPEQPLMQSSVKTLVYLKVRILFDPPETSFHLDALKRQIEQHEWRINVERESTEWVDPQPVVIPIEEAL